MSKPVIAVAAPNADKFSETFIHAHVRKLGEEVLFLHTGYLPIAYRVGWNGNDMPIPDPPGEQDRISYFLRQSKVALLLSEFGPTGVRVMHACKESGAKHVVHFHGYDAFRSDMLQSWSHPYSRLFSLADAIVVVSEEMRQQLVFLGAPPEKLHLIPCGADDRMFHAKMHDDPSRIVLWSGRFTAKKSPLLCLHAFARLREEFPDARMIMAGEGELRETCIGWARGHLPEEVVTFPGIVPHEDMPVLMSQADVWLSHYVTTEEGDREGSPVSVKEAMLTELPVITSRHADIPSWFEDGTHGFMVEPHDSDAVVRALLTLFRDPDNARIMGAAGRRKILDGLTLVQSVEKLHGLLQSLLNP